MYSRYFRFSSSRTGTYTVQYEINGVRNSERHGHTSLKIIFTAPTPLKKHRLLEPLVLFYPALPWSAFDVITWPLLRQRGARQLEQYGCVVASALSWLSHKLSGRSFIDFTCQQKNGCVNKPIYSLQNTSTKQSRWYVCLLELWGYKELRSYNNSTDAQVCVPLLVTKILSIATDVTSSETHWTSSGVAPFRS